MESNARQQPLAGRFVALAACLLFAGLGCDTGQTAKSKNAPGQQATSQTGDQNAGTDAGKLQSAAGNPRALGAKMRADPDMLLVTDMSHHVPTMERVIEEIRKLKKLVAEHSPELKSGMKPADAAKFDGLFERNQWVDWQSGIFDSLTALPEMDADRALPLYESLEQLLAHTAKCKLFLVGADVDLDAESDGANRSSDAGGENSSGRDSQPAGHAAQEESVSEDHKQNLSACVDLIHVLAIQTHNSLKPIVAPVRNAADN